MKVIFFTPRPFSLAFGGTEVQLLETKSALEDLGLTVELIDYFNRDQITSNAIVHLFGSDYVFAQIAKLLNGRQIPYIVSSIFYPTGLSYLLYRASAFFPYSASALRKSVLREANKVLPNSQSEGVLLERLFGLSDSSIEVIPNAVRGDFLGQDPDGFRRKYLPSLPKNERFVLSVGRIEKRKNSLNLLRAAAHLKVPLVFIGTPVALPGEGKYVARFQEELGRYPGYVRHIPFLPNGSHDLADAYAAAHVHALISRMETPGLANLEAGLNGANLVVGNSPPVWEYLSDHAFFVDQDNLNQIADVIERSINQNRDVNNQSTYIRENYSWHRVAKLLINVYKEVVKG